MSISMARLGLARLIQPGRSRLRATLSLGGFQSVARLHPAIGSVRSAGSSTQTTSPLPSLSSSTSSVSSLSASPDFSDLPAYRRPEKGILGCLPDRLVPYGELIRIDKPAGTVYLFFPCLFSTLLAAPVISPMATPSHVVGISALFLAGAFITRSAGCTINDIFDRRFDVLVRRTRHRPIARGAVSVKQASWFLIGQGGAALAVLCQFPIECIIAALPSTVVAVLYPLAKRVTYYPQFVLGLAFSWGSLLGFPALGVDPFSIAGAVAASAWMYGSTAIWTVFYDMVYAHMDLKDDVRAGVKSIVVAHGTRTKQIMSVLAICQIGTLAAAGAAIGAGPLFYTFACGGGAATLATQIARVKLDDPTNCLWWFTNGCWITGGTIATGLAVEYAYRLSEENVEQTGHLDEEETTG